ncbi:MAG: hypothetical protein NZT92_06955 [Abditibacteriales bacterium]|nr:hypothetical protein [Abditibacteriales bacterium]MDW8364739.1 hypothetical protein [Abditibacteriales bacterium]
MNTLKTVALPDQLFEQVQATARQAGYAGVEELIAEALEEKMLRLKRKRLVTATGRPRARLDKRGAAEEAILNDFERLRSKDHECRRRRHGRVSAEEEIARFGVYEMGQFEPMTRGELYGDC